MSGLFLGQSEKSLTEYGQTGHHYKDFKRRHDKVHKRVVVILQLLILNCQQNIRSPGKELLLERRP